MNKTLGCFFTLMCIDAQAVTFEESIVSALLERTKHNITYDGAYHSIAYPGGDVPENIGVCTDVIIRSYRKLGKVRYRFTKTCTRRYVAKLCIVSF